MLVACVVGRLFCRNYVLTANFYASVGTIQLSRFRFSVRNFRLIIFNISLLISAQNFSHFCFSDSNFQVSVGKF